MRTYSDEDLARLRAIRLYHWLKVKKFRKAGKDRKANTHLGYVQALNDFFPIGDTAEGDEK